MKKMTYHKKIFCSFIIAGLTPLVIVGLFYLKSNTQLSLLNKRLIYIEELADLNNGKNQANNLTIKKYHLASPSYIDKVVENIFPLKEEKALLNKIENEDSFVDKKFITNRLEFLKKNRLRFSEESVHTLPALKETVEVLMFPVEVNINDIKTILAVTEGVDFNGLRVPEDLPLLIIKDFSIQKKTTSNFPETFSLNLKLIKREFP